MEICELKFERIIEEISKKKSTVKIKEIKDRQIQARRGEREIKDRQIQARRGFAIVYLQSLPKLSFFSGKTSEITSCIRSQKINEDSSVEKSLIQFL